MEHYGCYRYVAPLLLHRYSHTTFLVRSSSNNQHQRHLCKQRSKQRSKQNKAKPATPRDWKKKWEQCFDISIGLFGN